MSSVREGPTTVIKRCLALLRRLQQGPADKEELIASVLDAVDREAYGGAAGKALDKRFEYDKRKLEDLFGLQVRYRRATGTYEIEDVWEPLLDLPDEALTAIAFLQETFDPSAPMHDQVQNFLGLLVSYLSPERRGDLERGRTALQVEWGQRDDDVIAPGVEAGLSRALIERRLVAFDYHSPAQADGVPRRHTVEPWERYFDSVRGHYYLRGYCRRTVGPYGEHTQNRYFYYRLGRIRNLEVLPGKLPPRPPSAPRVELVYRLTPKIARRGEVTRHPEITILRTESQEDESIIVHAETENVWWAVRSLLHYGPNCQVLGGDEALFEMRRTVKEMAGVYGVVGGDDKGRQTKDEG
jgi:predicted DNA-binding transcriptional regulator YafY